MTFGDKLKSAREEQGMTQEQLGKRCGLEQSYIAHLERGARKPCFDNFVQIVRSLRIDANRLLPDQEAAG